MELSDQKFGNKNWFVQIILGFGFLQWYVYRKKLLGFDLSNIQLFSGFIARGG